MYVCTYVLYVSWGTPYGLCHIHSTLVVGPNHETDPTYVCMYVPTYAVVHIYISTYMCMTATNTFQLTSWPLDCLLACGSPCLYTHTDNDMLYVCTLMLHAQSSLSLSLSVPRMAPLIRACSPVSTVHCLILHFFLAGCQWCLLGPLVCYWWPKWPHCSSHPTWHCPPACCSAGRRAPAYSGQLSAVVL